MTVLRLTVRGTEVELRRPEKGEGWEVYSQPSGDYVGHVVRARFWIATSWMGHQIGGLCSTRHEAVSRLLVED